MVVLSTRRVKTGGGGGSVNAHEVIFIFKKSVKLLVTNLRVDYEKISQLNLVLKIYSFQSQPPYRAHHSANSSLNIGDPDVFSFSHLF